MKKYLLLCLTSMLFALAYPSYVNAQDKFKPKYLRENDRAFLQLTSQATDNGWVEFKKDKDTEGVSPDNFSDRFVSYTRW